MPAFEIDDSGADMTWRGLTVSERRGLQSLEDVHALFNSIRRDHPHLEMLVEQGANPICPLSMTVPEQANLRFELVMSFVNGDELCIGAGDSFWLEWFPMRKTDVVEDFTKTVGGLLSGEYRVVEYLNTHGVVVKADLQEPSGAGWKTAGTWRASLFVFADWIHRGLKQWVLQNQPDGPVAGPRQPKG